VPAKVFRETVTTDSPQGVAALVHRKEHSLEDTLRGAQPALLMVAAGLQDPETWEPSFARPRHLAREAWYSGRHG